MDKKNMKKIILITLAAILVVLVCCLLVLKLKKNNEKQANKPVDIVKKDENNYVTMLDLENELNNYKDIGFNKNNSIENIKLYGLTSLNINKISIENNKLKFYVGDEVYTDGFFNSKVKYIEYASDCGNYSEILVYTSTGVYYYNTSSNAQILDEEEKNSYYGDSKEYASYELKGSVLTLDFIKVSNTSKVTGIGTVNNISYDTTCNFKYFVVNTTSGVYNLEYIKQTTHGLNLVNSVKLGSKLASSVDYISYIKSNDYPLFINYDLTVKNKENVVITDLTSENIIVNKVFTTKDAHYLVTKDNNIYKLSFTNSTTSLEKFNTKDIEKVVLEEEKMYQGETMAYVKQYIKIIYIDGTKEEIL